MEILRNFEVEIEDAKLSGLKALIERARDKRIITWEGAMALLLEVQI